MKSKVFPIVSCALVALFLLSGWVQQPQTEAASTPGSITVNGEAEVRVIPDEVVLTLGVETSNKNLDTARRENDRIVAAVFAVTKKYAIPAERVQTDYIAIEPRYEDRYTERAFIGYFVNKTIVITLRDLSQFERFYSDVLGAGVNYVHGVQFRTTALRANRDKARELALQAAREKATAMAAALGQEVGQPILIQETQNDWASGYGAWWGGRWGGGMTQNVIQNASGGWLPEDGSLAPGQISVKATVTVQFEMKSK